MCRPIRIALVLLLLAATARAGDGRTRLLATADGEGALAPCADCPLGLGGMARRATLVTRERASHPELLLLDAGNSLFGPESFSSKGEVVARLFSKLGYDAVNVSWRDFRLGRAATIAALADRDYAVLSANVTDAETGELLFAPSALLEAGGGRVLVVGATRAPTERTALPHLARQLEGVGFRPAAEAVRAALESAPEHDSAVLLYYGDAASLHLDLGDLLPRFSAVVLGGAHPDEVPREARPPLLAVRPEGRSIASMSLGAADAPAGEIRVEPGVPESPEVARIVADALAPATDAPPPRPDDRPGDIPDSLSRTRGRLDIRGEGENRGFGLIVHGVEVAYNLGHVRPKRGRRLMLVDVSVENRLAPDLILEDGFPETMQVMDVRRQFFLLLNGATILPIIPDAPEEPDHLPAGFRLAPGDAADGVLAFQVPEDGIQSLELRFYADGFAPIIVPLKEGAAPPPEDPIAGPFDNGEIEIGVTGFERRDEFFGQKPENGRIWAVVRVRGRSRLAMDTPALALDPDAAPGEKARAGQVFEWKRGRELIQLVTQGLWGYRADEISCTAEVPLFLPDVTAGYRLAFQVPEGDETFRLDCHFPRMKLSTEREFRDPKPIVLPIRGDEPQAPRIALAAIDDSPLRVGVLDLEWADEFDSRASGDKYDWAVFTIAFRNEGEEGGLLDPAGRFGLAWADRQPTVASSLSKTGPRPGAGLAYLPPGQVRAFQVVFRVPEDVTRVELTYTGVSTSARLPFDRDAPAEATAALATPEEAAPPAPGVSPRELAPREPKGLEGFGIDGADVNRAIDRGREFLWTYLNEKHFARRYEFGQVRSHTLCALALIHSGAVPKTPGFDAELRKLLARAPLRTTYEMGLYLMTVRSYGDPEFYPRAAEVAQVLVNQQGPEGSWGYGEGLPAVEPEPEPEEVPPEAPPVRQEGPFQVTGGDPAPAPEEGESDAGGDARFEPVELERQVPWDQGENGDNSTSQFALLGLRAAESMGIGVPDETWRRGLESYRRRQDESGGWGYGQAGAYGSMTCAGICSIALAGHALGVDHYDRDAALERGVAWLGDRFRAERNPLKREWAYYYIYSVERVGRLLGTEFIGPWEWYPLGVKSLLARQNADGSWIGTGSEGDPDVATSFALLFLTRATEGLTPEPEERPVAEERPGEEPGPGRLVTKAVKPAAARYYFILDASGSMRAKMGERTRFDVARDALRQLVDGLPDDAVVGLRVYGHRYFAIAPEANRDSELVLPLGRLDRAKFDGILASLKPKGKTPLTFSLSAAKKDLGQKPVTVVLLTDGGEDTIPRQDPVAAAKALAAGGDVEVKILGFAIGRPAWETQLKEMAAAAGGKYLAAGGAEALAAGLRASAGVVPTSFEIVDEAGETVAEAEFGEEIELAPGRYLLRTRVGDGKVQAAFTVSPGATVRIVYDPTLFTSHD